MNSTEAENIYYRIKEERINQDMKWGEQNHSPMIWMNILMEEVGEAAKAIIENKKMAWELELIQVAAVAVAAIEALRRNCND